MNLEPYRQIFEERELVEAEQTIAELKRMVDQLDLAIANYQDAWNSLARTLNTDRTP